MINYLALQSPLHYNHSKYVDDLAISEVFTLGSTSRFLTKRSGIRNLDSISQWAAHNNMHFNPTKWKEMVICQHRTKTDFPPLLTHNLPLDHVSSDKVVGIMLCNILKWNDNINEIVIKASRRFYYCNALGSLLWISLLSTLHSSAFCLGVLLRYLGNKPPSLSQ